MALFFSVSHAESSSDEENSHISEESCNKSVFEYELETSGASTSNYSDYVALNAPRNLMNNPLLTSICDRLKITDNALMIMSSFIKACGGDLYKFCLTRSTINRNRIANQLKASATAVNESSEDPQMYGTIHWDDKLIVDRLGERCEALCIVMSGSPGFVDGKLLAVEKSQHATDKAQAEEALDLLEMKNIIDGITTLIFDTTASNSG